MYDRDGQFGRSRVAVMAEVSGEAVAIFGLDSAGWHRCNALYRISRPAGGDLWLLMVTTGGRGTLCAADGTYDLLPGSIAFVPPGVPVEYYTLPGGEWEFYWLHPLGQMAELFLNGVCSGRTCLRYYPLPEKPEVVHRLEVLLQLVAASVGQNLELSAVLSDFFHWAGSARYQPGRTAELSARVIQIFRENLSHPISMDEIGQQLFISTPQLIRRFKKETGMTPYAYLLKLRLSRAQLMLQYTDLPVEIIARETGFSSASHFAYRFRLSRGMTPTAFRREGSVSLP